MGRFKIVTLEYRNLRLHMPPGGLSGMMNYINLIYVELVVHVTVWRKKKYLQEVESIVPISAY